jgi:hypothetical protein
VSSRPTTRYVAQLDHNEFYKLILNTTDVNKAQSSGEHQSWGGFGLAFGVGGAFQITENKIERLKNQVCVIFSLYKVNSKLITVSYSYYPAPTISKPPMV